MTATLALSAAIIKELYPDGEVPDLTFQNNPALQWVPKRTDFVGNPARVPLITEHTHGASADFTQAQANLKQSKYTAFSVTRVKDYSLARIESDALLAADGDEGSLVELWETEMKMAARSAVRSIAIQMYRTGTGSRCQLSNVSSATATLANVSETTNFGIGMSVQASATDGSALRDSGAKEVILGVDYINGTLTSTNAGWATVITTIGTTDFLYRAGDACNNSTHVVIEGFQSWLYDGTAPALFSVTRTTDPLRLAGQVYNASGVSPEEAVIEAIARNGQFGGAATKLFCHNRDKANTVKSLEAKSRFMRPHQKGSAQVGYESIEFSGDYGSVELIADMNCPRNKAFLLQEDMWFLGSIRKAPHIQDYDTNTFLRVSTSDAQEARFASYLQLVCKAPGNNVHIKNFGT